MKIDDAKLKEPGEGLRRKRQEENVTGRISVINEENREEIRYVAVEKIIPYHGQPRIHFDEAELQKLADTIKTHGIRQPLTIIQAFGNKDFFEVVSGERRLRAAIMAGLTKVPCLLIHDHVQAKELSIIENIQRADLHPIELGMAYHSLMDMGICITQQEIADKLGVSRTHVLEMMNFASFPDHIKKKLISQKITKRDILREISKCRDGDIFDERKVDTLLSGEKEKRKKSQNTRKKMLLGIYSTAEGITVSDRILYLKSSELLVQLKKEMEKTLDFIHSALKKIEEEKDQE
jgi:ParB family chromosome partitioning protein